MKAENYFIDLKEILPNIEEYYAHKLSESEKEEFESLNEHAERCKKYFVKIFNSKGISEVVEEFEKKIFKISDKNPESMNKNEIDIFRKCLFNIITFHDIGKINPLFQKRKMKNRQFENGCEEVDNIGNLKSNHSRLSSIIYVDYFKGLLKTYELENNEKLIKVLISMFAFVISRHHSDLKSWREYMDLFVEKRSGFQAEIDLISKLIKEGTYIRDFKCTEGNDGINAKYNKRFKNITSIKTISEYNSPVYFYTVARLMYSLLVASDYYATTEFMNGVEIDDFGDLKEIELIYGEYKSGEIYKSIDKYRLNRRNTEEINKDEINVLRSELFLDAENELENNTDKNIFYLEAPTGSGKSNTAMNLSFKLMEKDKRLNKIMYIYPFNTLVEQNLETLNKVFGNNGDIMSQIAVVNSLFKLKEKDKNDKLYEYKKDVQTLLDRQFLNYPIVLSTHVMLFKTLFGDRKEDAFGFHQLCNSVIVLDEIQSYKINIWSEIIRFLESMAKMMNIKVIIMSATLPKLDMLLGGKSDYSTHNLISDREKYFNHVVFKNRVIPDYSLLSLKGEEFEEAIIGKIVQHKENKVLIEFITKNSATEFYGKLKNTDELESTKVILMTGDSSLSDRKKSIDYINNAEKVIVVATQVVEAGVDIDMDVGFKDISRLDSEEQFMGRINRSSKKDGAIVYFFDYKDACRVYKNDIRLDGKLILKNKEMQHILFEKDFESYYNIISENLRSQAEKRNDENVDKFFKDSVGNLDMKSVSDRMRLIEDDMEKVSIFVPRELKTENGEIIKGEDVWGEYKALLLNNTLEYATKKVKLHNIRTEMCEFIYEINDNEKCLSNIMYNDRIGNMLYVENREGLIVDGVLNKSVLMQENMFI